MARPAYPFEPKSSVRLTPGDFWSIPLQDGSFACGRVLQLPPKGMFGGRVAFFGGLLDWHGESPPTSDAIAGAKTLNQGSMHILSITRSGGSILGNRPLELDGVEPWLCINGGRIQRGYTDVRAWALADNTELPTYSGWGYNMIWLYAHKHFLGYLPRGDSEPTA